jgi:hypothetical protein
MLIKDKKGGMLVGNTPGFLDPIESHMKLRSFAAGCKCDTSKRERYLSVRLVNGVRQLIVVVQTAARLPPVQ